MDPVDEMNDEETKNHDEQLEGPAEDNADLAEAVQFDQKSGDTEQAASANAEQ